MGNRYSVGFLYVIFIGFSFGLQAQRNCGTMTNDSIRRAQWPGLGSIEHWQNWLAPQIESYKQTLTHGIVAPPVYHIPVVFHVIHNGEPVGFGTNISQAQINSQMQVLNEDYRKLLGSNGYNNHPDGADVEIEFCLALVDELGNSLAENGIHRLNRSALGLSSPPWSMAYIDASIKPVTIWNPDKYLNIWICEITGNILGYAQLPGGSGLPGLPAFSSGASTDGVVAVPNAIGAPPANSNNWPFKYGRTLTHEIGHWLGLLHIWGDVNGCGGTDYCADTPDQDVSSIGCPVGQNTCGSADMVENYLDYSDDICMNIFTKDQKVRMRTVLQVSPRRASLLNSTVCQSSNGNPPICSFSMSSSTVIQGGSVDFFDNSSNNPTAWAWQLNGGNPDTANGQNPTGIVFPFVGSFSATLVASNSFGSCSISQTITVIPNPACNTVIGLSGNDEHCNQSDGAITALPSGGTAPYSFLWSNGATTASISSLSGGTYTVSVTDQSGCTKIANHTILNKTPLLSSTVINASCGGNDGAIHLGVSGASFPHNYVWSNGDTDSANTGLSAGTYSVTFQDGIGCIALGSYQVNTNGGVNVVSNTQNATCKNLCDGFITLDVQGGQSPYTYQWSNGAGTDSIHSLCDGTYTVSVSDNNACVKILNLVIGFDHSLNVDFTISPELCEASNGSLQLSASGGQLPYSFLWSANAGGSTDSLLVGLSGDVFFYTVSDDLNCTWTDSIEVPSLGSMDVVTSGDVSICNGQSAFIYAIGGDFFNWSTGASTSSVVVAPSVSSVYTVTVSNNTGCSEIKQIAVQVTPYPQVSLVANPIIPVCAGESVVLTAQGANQYLWSIPGVGNDSIAIIHPFELGNYSVAGQNGNCVGLPSQVTVPVIAPAPVAKAIAHPTTVFLSQGGKLHLYDDSCTGNFFEWDINGDGTTDYSGVDGDFTHQYTANGNYWVKVTVTLNDCSLSDSILITVLNKPALGLAESNYSQHINFFPNPATDKIKLYKTQPIAYDLSIVLCNSLGETVSNHSFFTTEKEMDIPVSQVPSGIYYIKVNSGAQQMVRKIVVQR